MVGDTREKSVRAPAQAGRFYPADAAEGRRQIDGWLGDETATRRCRALMLPHAGWTYCGRVIGETLAGVALPSRAIVVSPRHTPRGAPWSVAPQTYWELPGDRVPIDGRLRAALLAAEPRLVPEPDAHAGEHGVEVLLPFLRRVRPDLSVLPVVLGQADYADACAVGDALAAALASDDGEPPMLVISSDMNHFADEAENRRLDGLALDAMETGDPRRLHDVVREHDISMCGVIPAVAIMRALGPLTPAQLTRTTYTTSAEASGDTSRVVGYAGMRIA